MRATRLIVPAIALTALTACSPFDSADRQLQADLNSRVAYETQKEQARADLTSKVRRIANAVKKSSTYQHLQYDDNIYANPSAFDDFPLKVNATFIDSPPLGNLGPEDSLDVRVYGHGVIPTPQGCQAFLQFNDLGLDGFDDGRGTGMTSPQSASCLYGLVTENDGTLLDGPHVRLLEAPAYNANALYRKVIDAVIKYLKTPAVGAQKR
jgi:hypothetical protein